MKKKAFYLIDEGSGEAESCIYFGTTEDEALQEALESKKAFDEKYIIDGHRIIKPRIRPDFQQNMVWPICNIYMDSWRIQDIETYEVEKAERQKVLSIIYNLRELIDIYEKAELTISHKAAYLPHFEWAEGGHKYSAEWSGNKGTYTLDGCNVVIIPLILSMQRMFDAYQKRYRLGQYVPDRDENPAKDM